MAEPAATAATAGTSMLAVAILSMLPGVDPAMVLGAFSGSVIFVMSAKEMSAIEKIAYLLPSFGGGLLAANLATSVLTFVLPEKIVVNPGVGAMLASALVVKTLHWLIARDPSTVIDFLRGLKR